jgi:hypothetical protein
MNPVSVNNHITVLFFPVLYALRARIDDEMATKPDAIANLPSANTASNTAMVLNATAETAGQIMFLGILFLLPWSCSTN